MVDQSDTMMAEFDYGISRFIVVACLLFLVFCAGFIGGIWYEATPYNFENTVASRTLEEEAEYHAILDYHGLRETLTPIHHDSLGRYFIRDGKRCSFAIPETKRLAVKRGGAS